MKPVIPPSYESVEIGDLMPELLLPPLGRATLALFAGASGDHNPAHIDMDAARAAGLPDVFAHGMLTMAWLGRLLTDWAPQHQLRTFDVRFAGVAHLGDAIRCTGRVAEKTDRHGERCVRLELTGANQDGHVKITGSALIALS